MLLLKNTGLINRGVHSRKNTLMVSKMFVSYGKVDGVDTIVINIYNNNNNVGISIAKSINLIH